MSSVRQMTKGLVFNSFVYSKIPNWFERNCLRSSNPVRLDWASAGCMFEHIIILICFSNELYIRSIEQNGLIFIPKMSVHSFMQLRLH